MTPRTLAPSGQYIPNLNESFIGIELSDSHHTYRAVREDSYDFWVKEIEEIDRKGELKNNEIFVSKKTAVENLNLSIWQLPYSPYKDATDVYSGSETTSTQGRGKILSSPKIIPAIVKGSIPSGRVVIGKSIKSLISSESMRGRILTD